MNELHSAVETLRKRYPKCEDVRQFEVELNRFVETAAEQAQALADANARAVIQAIALADANARAVLLMADLDDAKTAALAASGAKSRFLASMSHEIRTPLNGVIGVTDLLVETSLTAEQREYVEIMQISARGLLCVINDILDLSKIEAGKLDLDVQDFDLRSVIETSIAPSSLEARKKKVDLTCHVEPGVPSLLRGDPRRLWQIIVNLVGNAIKFTDEGSVAARVSLENQTDAVVRLRFEVEDTGIGIPPDRLEMLFESFSQTDGTIARKYGGTGLGLTISKQLAGMMGGEIGVTSAEAEGSTFWFTAVFEKQTSGTTSDRRGETGPQIVAGMGGDAATGLSILVAEDNHINQMVIKAILGKLGYTPAFVGNGKEAVEALSSVRYDLVFMDVEMPVMNGLEAVEAIRDPNSSVLNHDVPIIALTAHVTKCFEEQCSAGGMTRFLRKPVRPKAIAELLEELT